MHKQSSHLLRPDQSLPVFYIDVPGRRLRHARPGPLNPLQPLLLQGDVQLLADVSIVPTVNRKGRRSKPPAVAFVKRAALCGRQRWFGVRLSV